MRRMSYYGQQLQQQQQVGVDEDANEVYVRARDAIESNNVEQIKQLLNFRHAIETLAPDAFVSSSNGDNTLNWNELLVLALELDHREVALEMIMANVGIQGTNDENSNCLMLAARRNNLECLDRLLSRREILLNALDIYGWTALMYASYYGHHEVAKSLLLAGAQADIYDNDHMTSLIWAAGRGHAECVSKLLHLGRAKVNQVDKCGTSPLIWACRKGFTEVASTLIKAGANVDSIGMFGWSALSVVVHGNHVETLKLLLQHKPNVNTCDSQHHTPLIAASKDNRVEIVALLLKARAFVNLSDEYGHTALIHAVKGSHLEVVDLLLKHHADIDHSGIDKKTALFWAVEKGSVAVVERLLQAKPNLELASKDGETCLMRAVKLRKPAIVRVLLAHQARVSTTDKNGDTVLHMAVKLQSATLALLILSNSKNHHLLNKCNKAKKTPLMLDNENTSKVFPAVLELQQNSPNKISSSSFNIHSL